MPRKKPDGYVPRKTHYWTPEEVELLVKRRQEGVPYSQISKEMGLSIGQLQDKYRWFLNPSREKWKPVIRLLHFDSRDIAKAMRKWGGNYEPS